MARLPCHMLINAQPAKLDSHQLEIRLRFDAEAPVISYNIQIRRVMNTALRKMESVGYDLNSHCHR
jgi:hypothetical protein